MSHCPDVTYWLEIDMQLQNTQGAARRPFVMLNAPVCEPTDALLKHEGYYDPDSQTWVGRIEIGAVRY